MRFRRSNGAAIATLNLTSSGKLGLRNDGTAASTSSAVDFTDGRWHEVQFRASQSTSSVEVWVDGLRVDDLSGVQALGAEPIGRVEIGEITTGKTFDIAFDDVMVDTQFMADGTAPFAPTGLDAIVAANRVDLSWTAAVDNIGVTGYDLYRDGTIIAHVTGTSYADTGVDPETEYSSELRAWDAGENESAASEPLVVTTPSEDPTPPTTPEGVQATPAWPSSVDVQVGTVDGRYRRDGLPDPPRRRADRHGGRGDDELDDTTLPPGSDATYTVTAADAGGNVSDASDPARVRLALFWDDFEDAGLVRWNGTTGGMSTTANGGFGGSGGALATANSGSAWAWASLPAPQSDVVASVRFKVLSAAGQVYVMKLRTATGTPVIGLYRNTGAGGLVVRNKVHPTDGAVSTTPVSLGDWHELRLQCGSTTTPPRPRCGSTGSGSRR